MLSQLSQQWATVNDWNSTENRREKSNSEEHGKLRNIGRYRLCNVQPYAHEYSQVLAGDNARHALGYLFAFIYFQWKVSKSFLSWISISIPCTHLMWLYQWMQSFHTVFLFSRQISIAVNQVSTISRCFPFFFLFFYFIFSQLFFS